MYSDWLANCTVIAATIAAICLSVLVHYEGLIFTSRRIASLGGRRRTKILYGIASVLILHVCEIWIFGLILWLLLQWPACGSLRPAAEHLFDVIYFSAITFTTVGFGDLAPVGPIRFMSGTEALTGFVLITWSASFTYLEMERFWRNP
jgi:type IV secretory pathway TrbD component